MTKSKKGEIEHDGQEFSLICPDHFLRKSVSRSKTLVTTGPLFSAHLVKEIQYTLNMGSAEKQQKWKDYRICRSQEKDLSCAFRNKKLARFMYKARVSS